MISPAINVLKIKSQPSTGMLPGRLKNDSKKQIIKQIWLLKIQVPARLHRSDRIGSAILFLSFVPLFLHHLVSNSTHCYDFKIRVIFKTLSDSSYMYLYRMWVCLRLVSPYFIHQLLFCKCSAWRSCKLI